MLHQNIVLPFSKNEIFNQISQINIRQSKNERVLRVLGSKVVFANYPLLMNDFPQLGKSEIIKRLPYLLNFSELGRRNAICGLIDKWILKHTSFISINQASQEKVNSRIPTDSAYTNAFRPQNYGRALIFSIQENLQHLGISEEMGEKIDDKGLIDAKGTGVGPNDTPDLGIHQNGLMGLDECFKELLFEQMIHRILHNEKSSHQTLPIYSIVDLGFDLVFCKRQLVYDKKERKWVTSILDWGYRPAGMVLRRAHNRLEGDGDLPLYRTPQYRATKQIELLLRKYGIRSSNYSTFFQIVPDGATFNVFHSYRQIATPEGEIKQLILRMLGKHIDVLAFEGINVQLTADIRLNPLRTIVVDFGHYNVQQRFGRPLLFLSSDQPIYWGDVVWPGSRYFVQPQAEKCLPFAFWGGNGEIFGFSDHLVKDKIRSLTLGLATAYREKKINGFQAINVLEKLIWTATSKWH